MKMLVDACNDNVEECNTFESSIDSTERGPP